MTRRGRRAPEPRSEPAQPQSDLRHGFASTVAGLGVYGALLLCLMALA
jgi:hypothetical protein